MTKRLKRERLVPWVLFFLCFLSHGLWIPELGFYWDDWAKLWFGYSIGSPGGEDLLFDGRPYLGQLIASLIPRVGQSPLTWHILSWLARFLATLAFWWTLRGVWPQRTGEVSCVAMLFTVYPGFTLQPIALVFSQVGWLPFLLFLFSLGAMIWALRKPRWLVPLTAAALATSAGCMVIKEYFLGLELLRPLLLWLVLMESGKGPRQYLRRTLTHWLPYLGVLVLFSLWRLLLYQSPVASKAPSAHLSAFAADPSSWVLIRLLKGVSDIVESGLMAWTQTFRPDIFRLGSTTVWLSWGLVVVVSLAVALFLRSLAASGAGDSSEPGDRSGWPGRALVVGLLAIIVGLLPALFINRHVVLGSFEDRLVLPTMIGACILLVALAELILRTRVQRIILISLILGLSVGFHFRNGERFHDDWLVLKNFLWQLSWRAPDLEPGTSILIGESPSSLYQGDFSLAIPLNLLYSREAPSFQLDYWLFVLGWEAGRQVPRLVENAALDSSRYFARFTGSTSNSLVIWYSPPSCLRVVDSARDEIPLLPPLERAAREISHLERIRVSAQPKVLPVEVFGEEPEHGWCYYLQKADLARQKGSWDEVVDLGQESKRLGLEPRDASEWMPFIEAYANLNRYQEASDLAVTTLKSSRLMQAPLCEYWRELEDSGLDDEEAIELIGRVQARLSCPPAESH